MPGFLNKFQIMNPYEVRNNYQWWRPLSALFITNGFEQYMFSTAYLLLFGYMLASTKMSNLRMLVFYCLCGYVGNMFGAICDSNGALFCGDSPATFGMFAAMISCLCVNWHALDSMPQMRCPLIFTLVMFTMMLMLNSAGGSAFNDLLAFHTHQTWSSWGGFLMGFPLGLVMVPRARRQDRGPGSYGRLCAYIGIGWLVVYLSILFSCFFTVYDPKEHFF